jgi:hypothetical protein
MAQTVHAHPASLSEIGVVNHASRWYAWLGRYHWAVALLAYTILTLVITFPAVLHLGDSIIGPLPPSANDDLWYVWYVWAFRQAVSTGQDPAFTHLIYALFPRVQLFAASYFSGSFGALLLPVMSPLAAYNILVLLGFILSGFTMYLLANQFIPNRWASFIAGFLYTFSTFHFWHATGQLDLATMQWLPLAAWRIVAFYRRPIWQNAIWMGLSVAMVPLSDLYLSAYFLVPFGLLFVGGLLLFNRHWLTTPRNLLFAGLGIAITVVATLPFLASSLQTDPALQAAIKLKASGNDTYSANLLSYFFPHPANPLFGSITARFYRHIPAMRYPVEQADYLGLVSMTLGAGAFLFKPNRTRTAYFWVLLAIGAFLLSLGPHLQVGGHILSPLPFYGWLYHWPILSDFRAPNRLGPTILIGVCMLAGYGLTSIFAAVPAILRALGTTAWRSQATALNQVAVMVLGILVMLTSLAENIQFGFPYPITSIHVPALYTEMGADPVPGLVLDLPVYPRGTDHFYQTIHHRALVGGYAIRESYPMALTIDNVPYLSLLDSSHGNVAHDPNAPSDVGLHDIFPLQQTFLQGLQRGHIRYVVLHAVHPVPRPWPVFPWMRDFLNQQLGTPIYDNSSEGLTAWRIDPGTPAPPSYRFVLGNGWIPGLEIADHHLVRMVQQDAHLFIDVPKAGSYHLSLEASAVLKPRTMVVNLNSALIQTVRLSQLGVPQTIDLGDVVLHPGENVLLIHVGDGGCVVPFEVNPSDPDPRCYGFGVEQVQMTPLE